MGEQLVGAVFAARRTAATATRLARSQPPAFVSLLLSLRRRHLHGVWSWPDEAPRTGPELALFVHYDPEGRVAGRVLHLLDALRAAGLEVLFVSNAGTLGEEARASLQARCAGILVRDNVGYDLGAVREALQHWAGTIAGARLLLLMNDSVLGPFAPLRPLLDRLDFDRADLWGAVDSPQRGWHLQTWFLAVGRRALDHPAWRRFWSGVRPVRSKEWVIGRYEIGLSRSLRRAGLRAEALFPYASLTARLLVRPAPGESPAAYRQGAQLRALLRLGYEFNPTAQLWREVLEAGCPFIKRELVERNPARVKDVSEWTDVVESRYGTDKTRGFAPLTPSKARL